MDLLTEPADPMKWAISSNLGLSGPADLCTWSLLSTTIALLNSNPNADNIVLMMTLNRSKKEASDAFVRADRRIKKRHAKLVAAKNVKRRAAKH